MSETPVTEQPSEVQLIMEKVRADFLEKGKMTSQAFLMGRVKPDGERSTPEDPWRFNVGLPGIPDNMQREILADMAEKVEGFFIVVVVEAWIGQVPKEDAEAIRKLQETEREGLIHALPDKEEALVVITENEVSSLRQWHATINREADKPTLGPWTEINVTIPRPGWKRYLPEKNVLAN